MRILLRVMAVAGIILAALVIAVLLYLTFGDFSRFKPQIESAASEALGRDFRIDGPLEIEVLPHPSVSADNVLIANAEWASDEPLLSVGHFAATIDLWSLLSGPVVVEQLEIADASVLLEQDADGRNNYTLEPATASTPEPETEPETAAGGDGLPVTLQHAAISSVTILVRRPETDDLTIAIDSLDIVTDEARVLAAVLAARVEDLAVGLDAKLSPVDAIGNGGQLSYELVAMLDDAEVSVEGDIDSLFASAPDSDGGVVRQHLRFDGSIASLNLLGAVFEIDNLPEQELALNGDLAFGTDGIAVDPMSVTLGDSDFSGSVSAELGEKLALVVEGKSSMLDLTPFFPAPPEDAASSEADDDSSNDGDTAAAAAAPESDGGDEARGPLLFPDEPLPFELLAKLDAEVDLTIDDFTLRDIRVSDFALALTNSDGQASLTTSFDGIYGGSAEGELTLDASAAESASIDVDFAFSDLRLNVFSGDLEDTDQIPPIGLTLDLTASGGTPHALASGANGRVVLTQGAGLIENNAVGLVSGDVIAQLFTALNPFAKEEEYTTLECTVIALNVTDGNGVLDPVLLETEKLQIIGGGEIAFDTEALDIEFNTKPRTGVGITADMFVTPFVKLSGTLAEPGIGMNAKGALLQGGAAVLTGGATLLLGGLADRATAEAGRCESTLAEIGAGGTGAPVTEGP